MNGIKYYYINLEARVDRKEHIINQFNKFGITNYERIPAIFDSWGPIGCSKSHILAIQTFIVSGYDKCIILEDDFEFTISPEKYNELLTLLFSSDVDWNIVMLSGNIKKSQDYNEFLKVCISGQTTSGYMIKRRFADKLLINYQEGLSLLSDTTTRNQNAHSIDQYWKKLQGHQNKWYVFNPKCGRQMSGFSDIEGKKTFYGC